MTDPECEFCGADVPGWKPAFCCNGSECSCGGRPIEPCVCSVECGYELLYEMDRDDVDAIADGGADADA